MRTFTAYLFNRQAVVLCAGAVLSTLQTSIHLVLTIILRDRHYDYSHFKDKEIEAQRD